MSRARAARLAAGPGLSWQDSALCAEVGGDIWFPEAGGNVAQPRAICRRCPVRAECLEFALANHIREGIWGGTTERQRRNMHAAGNAMRLAS